MSKAIEPKYYCQWQCKDCGKINIESDTKEILCSCCRKDRTANYRPLDLDSYIREFKRENFTHVNDIDIHHRASIAICDQVCKWLEELKKLRAKKLKSKRKVVKRKTRKTRRKTS